MHLALFGATHTELSAGTQVGLACFYFLCALLNVGFALYQSRVRGNALQALIWNIVAAIFLIHAFAYFPLFLNWQLPAGLKDATSNLMRMWGGQFGPIMYTTLSVVAFIIFLRFRRFLTEPVVAWTVLTIGLLFSGWAVTDDNFKEIITKGDNVPIVMLMFSVGFCTWMAMRKAVLNDERMAKGEAPLEKTRDDKVLVWPDLVYTELIAMVVCTFILVIWAVFIKAPLEQPASTSRIPNPSKAPWYFLGLQEMLVYYDPWMAGVVLPTMIIIGLIAIPYIDYNQRGNGYFTYVERKFSITMFLFGFVVLWVTLIVLGTFLRGPNWNFFGPFEPWNVHKTVPLNNINLSDYFWLSGLGEAMQDRGWLGRELPGILLVLGYLFILPPLLAKTVMRKFFIKMGFVRFMLLVTLIQFMASLPIKMVLRWTVNLKYIVFIPEYFFNI